MLTTVSSLQKPDPEPQQTEKLKLLLQTLDQKPDANTLDAIDQLLQQGVPACVTANLDSTELNQLAGGSYLRAKLAEASLDFEAAVQQWKDFLERSGCRDAGILHYAAQVFVRAGRMKEGSELLRNALDADPPFTFFGRCEKLLAQIRESAGPGLRTIRIALLASSTTSLFVPVLRALAFRDGIDTVFYEGAFGSIRQEILNYESGLYNFQPDIVFIIPHWHDLNLPAVCENERVTVNEVADDYVSLWQTLAARVPCNVVQHSFDLPAQEAFGYLAQATEGGRTRVIRLLNLELARLAPGYVSLLDTEEVARRVGIERWHNPFFWFTAKQHPAPDAIPALVEAQLSHIRAVVGLSRRVLICDLDNTLWGNVIGEDGIDGIKLGPGDAAGEAHMYLQTYLRELRQRGVLLAACSKNDPADAMLPFQKHPHCVLRLEDFAAFIANWDDKVTNLRRIAEMLSLSTDAFVFLDDDPVERAWVRSQMPEVAVVELGNSVFSYVRDLDRKCYFPALNLSEEDRRRTELYRSESARKSLQSSAKSAEEFLASLQMKGRASAIQAKNLARATQLINKANQFNVTTRRYSEMEVQELVATPGAWTGVFELSDKLTHHGAVGVIICVPETDGSWRIDTWIMSCRVLSRGFEYFMFDQVLRAAQKRGIRKIVGEYRPTVRNSRVADLYPRLGFRAVGNGSFALDLPSACAESVSASLIAEVANTF